MVKKIQIKYIILLVSVFLFLLFIGSANVISPFYGDLNLIDEGQFTAWILHMQNGDLLYKNTYAAYGPLLIYPYFLASEFFYNSFQLYRLVYGVFGVLISVSVVILILRTLKISFIFQVFGICMLILYPGFGLRQASGLLAIYLAYLAFYRNKNIYNFLTGISLVGSFLISSDMGIFSGLVILMIAFINLINTEDYFEYLKKVLVILLGGIITFFSFYLFSNYQGWFYPYIYSILDDLKSYSGIGIAIGRKFPDAFELFPQNFNLINLFKYIFSKPILNYWILFFYIISIVYFSIKFLVKKTMNEDILIFSIVIFGLLLSTILIGRIDNVNFVVPVIFIIFSYYLNYLSDFFRDTKNKVDKITLIIIGLVILMFCARVISIYRPHFREIPLAISAVRNNSDFSETDNIKISKEQMNDITQIKDLINKKTNSGERVFFFSNNPGLYLIVNRLSPTRFDLPEVANNKSKRLEIIDNIENNKTKYIIDYKKAYKVDGISNQTRLPEVMEYIKENYNVSKEGNFVIYTRK